MLPHLCHIEADPDPQVRKVAADMLLLLANGCTPSCFVEIMAIIEKVTDNYLEIQFPALLVQLIENTCFSIEKKINHTPWFSK